jgi:membrane fusion protein, multidrug efflux system
MRLAICAVLAVCGFSLPVQAQQREAPAVSVSTVAAERRPISKTLGFVGRVEAVDRVEIRARVTGFLDAVLFSPLYPRLQSRCCIATKWRNAPVVEV